MSGTGKSVTHAMAVQDVVSEALHEMWPTRSSRELLLDLGERKRWMRTDLDTQLGALASWLFEEGVVAVEVCGPRRRGLDAPTLRHDLAQVAEAIPAQRRAGTSAAISRLGPAVGTVAKTLSNSLSRGLRSSRPDHRWLLAIHRVVEGDAPLDAWVFHRRTPSALGAALTSGPNPDAGDALLLMSLVALWQRRRPTSRMRGNRGAKRPRRVTPKPVAALAGELVAPGQLRPLTELSMELGGERGRSLGALAIECALTEAHLGPHPSRGMASEQDQLVDSGEAYLVAAEAAITALSGASVVTPTDAAIFSYRVARMRAWRERTPPPSPPEDCASSPYVAACVALDQRRAGTRAELPVFHASDPGVAMLLPQLRAAGARIEP